MSTLPSEIGNSQTITHNSASYGANQIINNSGSINITQNAPETAPERIFDVPDLLSTRFLGRSVELLAIQEALDNPAQSPRAVVWGMPGIGKSQLVLKYAASAYNSGLFPYVFWISGSTNEKINQGFTKLLDLVGPGRGLDQAAKLTAARLWLENSSCKWLLVIDNANREVVATLRELLPRSALGKILITTRTKDVAEILAVASGIEHTIIQLKQHSVEDAVDLLASRRTHPLTQEDKQTAEKLVRAIGCLPLAIDQAASYMKQSGCSVDKLLEVYRSDLEDIVEWENSLSQHEERSVAATFALSFEGLANTSTATIGLLRVLSFIDPESIPVSLLVTGAVALRKAPDRQDTGQTAPDEAAEICEDLARLLQSPVKLQEIITQLQRLSLITTTDDESQTLWIHDLVQLLLRRKLIPSSSTVTWLKYSVWLVHKAFDEIDDFRALKCWPQCDKLASHVLTLLDHSRAMSVDLIDLLVLGGWLADFLTSAGRYQEALSLWRDLVPGITRLKGLEDVHTLSAITNLSAAYRKLYRYKDAEELDIPLVQLKTVVFGAEHSSTLLSTLSLAMCYEETGKLKESEELSVRVLEIQKRVLGPEHPDTLSSMYNLALVYRGRGRLDEALKLFKETTTLREKVLGPENYGTLLSITNLIRAYVLLQQLDEAEEPAKAVLETSSRVLGSEHPNTLQNMSLLASIYAKQHRWAEAEELQAKVVDASTRVLGAEHRDTILDMNALANIYCSTGRLEEAEKLEVKVFEWMLRVYGPEHRRSIVSMFNLATSIWEQGRDNEAVELMSSVNSLADKVLESQDPIALRIGSDLQRWQSKVSQG